MWTMHSAARARRVSKSVGRARRVDRQPAFVPSVMNYDIDPLVHLANSSRHDRWIEGMPVPDDWVPTVEVK